MWSHISPHLCVFLQKSHIKIMSVVRGGLILQFYLT
jgi:hypothetical protein